jgi:hypothetical protein
LVDVHHLQRGQHRIKSRKQTPSLHDSVLSFDI